MREPLHRISARALVVASVVFVGVGSVGHRAWAHESGGSQLPKDVPAVTDEGARAKKLVDEVEAASKPLPADVAGSVARARQALSRANGAHATGDARTARLLGKVALGWADAAKAQLAATRAERASGDVERAAVDLGARRERGRALVTEAQARKGQLATQIERKKRDIEAAKAPPKGKASDDKKAYASKPDDKKASGSKPDAKRPKPKPDDEKAAPDPKKTSPRKGAKP